MIQKSTATLPFALAAITAAYPNAALAQGAGSAALSSSESATESEWSLEPHGRLQLDAGLLDGPSELGLDENLDSEVRRARIGFEGTAPGGFGIRAEIDFSADEIEITDAYLSYKAGKLKLTAGQHNNFQSLEEISSSRFTSFVERAAFTDAFGFARRLGFSAQYSGNRWLLQSGVFGDNIDALPSKGRSADTRIVFMPKSGATQLHFGGSVHYSWNKDDSTVRYSSRPLVHFTETKLVDTGKLISSSELGVGLEAAAIRGPFHIAAESFWQHVNAVDTTTNPTFFGGYVEVGYFLTPGDSRSYSGGTFGRVTPEHPLGEGGWGALQVNLRYDHLDLTDGTVGGGMQDAYQASLVWTPTAHTRLMCQYDRIQYDQVQPAVDGGDPAFGVNTFAVRAQFDF